MDTLFKIEHSQFIQLKPNVVFFLNSQFFCAFKRENEHLMNKACCLSPEQWGKYRIPKIKSSPMWTSALMDTLTTLSPCLFVCLRVFRSERRCVQSLISIWGQQKKGCARGLFALFPAGSWCVWSHMWDASSWLSAQTHGLVGFFWQFCHSVLSKYKYFLYIHQFPLPRWSGKLCYSYSQNHPGT